MEAATETSAAAGTWRCHLCQRPDADSRADRSLYAGREICSTCASALRVIHSVDLVDPRR